MGELTGLEKATLVVHGERSELHLRDGVITVHKAATTQRTPTEISFEIEQVRAVTLNPPPRGGRGWIHISVVGGSPPPPSELAATGDPYTLPLVARGSGAAKRLARLVERHVQARGKPPDRQVPAGPNSGVVLTDAEPTPPRPAQVPPPPPDYPPAARPPEPAPAPAALDPDESLWDDEPAEPEPKPEPAAPGPASAGLSDDDVVVLEDLTPPGPASAGLPVGDEVQLGQPPRPEVAPGEELVAQLQQLADLHRAGALTDEEFERAKARVLG